MEKFILALDQGTTGTTVALVNSRANMVAKVNREHPQIYPRAGWVEHDAEAIWSSVTDGIREVLAKSSVRTSDIAGIGITNQRETVIAWEADTGRPVHHAIVWQDRRTTEFCERLKRPATARMLRRKTGLVVDPYFSASKIRWLLDNVADLRRRARKGGIKVGTVDSFLIWRLTGGRVHKTDVSNASRTQLMNIETGKWDSDLLELFRVPREILPEISDSAGILGATRGVPGLPDGLAIAGVAGDQQAALFGQTCFSPGAAKCTFGTGSFLLMNTGNKRIESKSGLLTTVAWRLPGNKQMTYALEGGAFICGAAVQWLRDQMGFIQSSSEIEALAARAQSTEGVYLVPAFVGLGAPYWDPDARAAILGMTRGTGRPQIARATLESMALQNVDILTAMEKDLRRKMSSLRVDGGAVQNDLLMQMQADFLGVPVLRPRQVESTVMGAAYLAGLGVGLWEDLSAVQSSWAPDMEFRPSIEISARRRKLGEWHGAIDRVRTPGVAAGPSKKR